MTVIICPACNTRFETAAVIPQTGRKVRCSKCGNVWQAMAVVEPAKPTVITAPAAPAAGPRPAPAMPRPAPAAPPPAAAPRPASPEPRPASAGPGSLMGRFPGGPIPQSAPAAPGVSARPNSGALANGGPVPAPSQAPAARRSGPLFSTDDDMQPDSHGAGLAGMGGNSLGGDQVQDLGSYNAGALVNPDAGLATNIPIAEGRKRKLAPPVAIGWGALALLLIILAALVAMAPKTVMSLLPGSARLYAMMGMNVNPLGLSIENVSSAWYDAGPNRVLQVSGDIVNLSAGQVTVPPLVVSLQDQSGKELSQVTANVPALAAGGKSPFTVQIPSPPESVRNLQVRFAKAK